MMNVRKIFEERSFRLSEITAVLLISIVALILRARGLSEWPLATDEYYILKSVENILEKGLPAFETGGYYVRGILYQYLVSIPILMGFDHVWALRAVSLLFNLLAIPAVYLLAKAAIGRIGGLTSILIFSISIWEIEFSRFGRMYAPFQSVFLWYLFFLYRACISYDTVSYRIACFLSGIGLLLWEGGLLLFVINFLPLVYQKDYDRKIWSLALISYFFIAYIYFSNSFSPPDSANLPREVIGNRAVSSKYYQPVILAFFLWESATWIVILSILLLSGSYTLFKFMKWIYDQNNDVFPLAISLVAFLSAVVNQFLITISLLFSLFSIGFIKVRDIHNKQVYPFIFSLAAFLVLWVLYTTSTDAWLSAFSSSSEINKTQKILVALFKYPNIFDTFIFPWFYAMPVYTMVTFSVIAFGAMITLVKDRTCQINYFMMILLTIMILSLLIGIRKTTYVETRYTFFLFPLMIILLISSIYVIYELLFKKKLYLFMPAVLSIIVYVSMDDFSLRHILSVDERDINYRINYDDKRAAHYYPRYDYRTPAEYINSNRSDGDIVIILDSPFEYYLDHLDYVYVDSEHTEFRARSRASGTIEKWTNANLLYKGSDVVDIIKTSCRTVWLIMASGPMNRFENKLYEYFKEYRVYTGEDGRYDVYRITTNGKCP